MKTVNFKAPPLWALSILGGFFASVFLLADRSAPALSAADMLLAMGGTELQSLAVISLMALLFRRLLTLRCPRDWGFAAVGGAVFALCDTVGYNIYFRDSLTRPQASLFSHVLDLSIGLGGFLLFTGLLALVFSWIRTHPIHRTENRRLDRLLGRGKSSFFLVFCLLMAISIPLQIYFYPGITNPDSFVQISEAMGLSPLSDAHPFLHTLMMRLVIGLGVRLFGTIGAGVTLYTFFQSVMVNLAVSYVLAYLARRGIHPVLRLLTLLYFALHPAIACYTITLWKDVWLSYFLLLYVVLLMELCLNSRDFWSRHSHMVFLLLVILGFLFTKNTSILVFVLTAPFLFFLCRDHRRQVTAVILGALVVLGIVRGLIIPAFHIQPGRISEPFSVPLQQVARTCVREGDSLTQEQIDIISEVLPYDRLPELYDPHLSDNVKGSLKEDVFSQDPMRYGKLWAQLGLRHPRAYLESFLANSCGYWYPGVIYWVIDPSWYYTSLDLLDILGDPDPNAENYQVDLNDYGRRHYFVHLYEMLQTVPGVSTLLSVAISFWVEFVLFLICLYKKKYKLLIPLLVPFATWLICIFSPVIAEYRYAFPAVVALPVLTAFVLQEDFSLSPKLGLESGAKTKGGNRHEA